MSIPFLKNFCGLDCTTSELLQVPRPKLELAIGTTLKSVEIGIVVGSVAIPFLQAALRRITDPETLKRGGYKGGLAGAYLGLLVGPLIALHRAHTMSNAEIYEQACLLRSDKTQLVIDRSAIIGGTLGYFIFGSPGFIGGVNLAILGTALSYFLFPDGAKQ